MAKHKIRPRAVLTSAVKAIGKFWKIFSKIANRFRAERAGGCLRWSTTQRLSPRCVVDVDVCPVCAVANEVVGQFRWVLSPWKAGREIGLPSWFVSAVVSAADNWLMKMDDREFDANCDNIRRKLRELVAKSRPCRC